LHLSRGTDLATAALLNYKIKVSTNDSAPEYIVNKFIAASEPNTSDPIELKVVNPGANETFKIAFDESKLSVTASQISDFAAEVTAHADVFANTAARHSHSNLPLLETYTQTEVDLADAVSKKHDHTNLALLETYTQTEIDIADAITKKHAHANQALLDTYAQTEVDLASAVSLKHGHTNLPLLETYTQTEAALAAAVAASHAHSNYALLETYAQTEVDLASAVSLKHSHVNLALLETYTQAESELASAVSLKHSHTNLALLETYTQTEVDLASAVSLKHIQGADLGLDTGGVNPVTAATIVAHHLDSTVHFTAASLGLTGLNDNSLLRADGTGGIQDTGVNAILTDSGNLQVSAFIVTGTGNAGTPSHTYIGDQTSGHYRVPGDGTAITAGGNQVAHFKNDLTTHFQGLIRSVSGKISTDVVPTTSATMFSLDPTSAVNYKAKAGLKLLSIVDQAGMGFTVETRLGLFAANNTVLKTTFSGIFDSLDFAVTGILGQVSFFSEASPGTAMGFNPGAESMFTNGTVLRFATGGGGQGMMSMDQANKTIVPSSTGNWPATLGFDLGGDSTNPSAQIRGQQWQNLRLMGGISKGLIFEHYDGGSVIDGKIISTVAKEIVHTSYVADSATAVGHIFDTDIDLTDADSKIASFRNATVEKAYVYNDGTISQAGSLKATRTSTAAAVTLTGADHTFYADSSVNAQTVNLPATPRDKQIFSVKNIDNTNGVTLSGNGNTIDGAATKAVFLTERWTVQYTSITGQWES